MKRQHNMHRVVLIFKVNVCFRRRRACLYEGGRKAGAILMRKPQPYPGIASSCAIAQRASMLLPNNRKQLRVICHSNPESVGHA